MYIFYVHLSRITSSQNQFALDLKRAGPPLIPESTLPKSKRLYINLAFIYNSYVRRSCSRKTLTKQCLQLLQLRESTNSYLPGHLRAIGYI